MRSTREEGESDVSCWILNSILSMSCNHTLFTRVTLSPFYIEVYKYINLRILTTNQWCLASIKKERPPFGLSLNFTTGLLFLSCIIVPTWWLKLWWSGKARLTTIPAPAWIQFIYNLYTLWAHQSLFHVFSSTLEWIESSHYTLDTLGRQVFLVSNSFHAVWEEGIVLMSNVAAPPDAAYIFSRKKKSSRKLENFTPCDFRMPRHAL